MKQFDPKVEKMNGNLPEYEPTTKDVIYQWGKDVKSFFGSQNVKDFGAMAVVTPFFLNALPYMLPTTVRKFKTASLTPKTYFTTAQNTGGYVGFGVGAVSLIVQVKLYQAAIENGYGGMCLIPLGTNAASGVYELVRNTKQRLKEKHNKSLVDKLA
jgi:hypothetical protein